MGRNIFARKEPHLFLERLSSVVHDGTVRPITRGELLHAH
jgi:DhnA family fructose-bisphosphate aldolase class Ia